MRIISWNLGFAIAFKRTTTGLGTISRRSTDIALLQEVVPPAWARDRWTIEARPIRDWGTAIVAKPGLKLQRTPDADAIRGGRASQRCRKHLRADSRRR